MNKDSKTLREAADVLEEINSVSTFPDYTLTEKLRAIADRMEAQSKAGPVAWVKFAENGDTLILTTNENTAAFYSNQGLKMDSLFLHSPADARDAELTVDDIRAVGGIVHKDGNIFFTNIALLNKAIAAKEGKE